MSRAIECYSKKDGITHGHAVSIVAAPDGTIWYGLDYLASWKNGHEVIASPVVSRGGHVVFRQFLTILPHDGAVWTAVYGEGMDGGLKKIENGALADVPIVLDGKRISHMSLVQFDGQNNLWVGSDGSGVFRLNSRGLTHYGSADGLTGESITGLMEDREHQMWVVTDRGVDVFRDLPVIAYGHPEGLPGAPATVASSRDGGIWIGEAGALQKLKDGKISSIAEGKALPGTMVGSMVEDNSGTLWVGIDSGLYTYERGKFSEIHDASGHPLGDTNSILVDGEGTIWALMAGRDPAHPDALDFKALYFKGRTPVRVDMKGTGAIGLMSARSKGVWAVATDGNIYSIRREGAERVGRRPDSVSLSAMLNDGAGGALLPTSYGLVHWDGKAISVLGQSNGLPCEELSAAIFDFKGNLWTEASCGLILVPKSSVMEWLKNPQAHVSTRLFTSIDGFAVNDVNRESSPMALDGNGSIYTVSPSYIGAVDAAAAQVSGVAPFVYIGGLTADRTEHAVNPIMRLPSRTRDITIRYSSTAYVHPELTTFRYRLDGYDTVWQQAGNRREAVYTNLPPGTYTFHVLATTQAGFESTRDSSIRLTIPPAFYQTMWFRMLGVCTALLVVWIVFRIRVRAATAIVESRLGERLMERDRIARELHDTLLQGFQGLLLQLQTAIRRIPKTEPEREFALLALNRGDEILLEGRDRVRDLRSHDSASGDLVEMLEKVVAQLQSSDGSLPELLVEGESREVPLMVAEEISLFVREALGNSMRHSQGKEIRCELRFEAKALRLITLDDGVGIAEEMLSPVGRSGHWGLQGMQERADKLNAKMKMQTGPAGTLIELRVPRRVAYLQDRNGIFQNLKALLR